MKKLLFSAALIAVSFTATAQVGVGTTSPEGALDVVSATSGVIVPRVANTAAVTAPVNGMVIYDLSSKCFKGYENNAWGQCFNSALAGADVSNTVLAQVGNEGDDPDVANSVVTVAQLATIEPAVTGLNPANETAYQDYIDANPALFSSPATQAEIQAMIDAVNTAATPATPAYTLTNIASYNGVSVIDATGIWYNNEAVPTASTITLNVDVTVLGTDPYTITATDATTGLTYSATGTFTATGAQTVELANNNAVMPEFFRGVITMPTTGNYTGAALSLEPRVDVKSIPGFATAVVDVTFDTQVWMDRNLGARRVATALDDVFSYGNHYQWGRPADGHEISVWNGTTATSGRGLQDATALEALSPTDAPTHNNFILTNTTPFDWRAFNNDNRWVTANQGPCPTGYHVPTNTEWNTADTFGTWANNTDTYNSTLKLPSSGYRDRANGLLNRQGTYGNYWSSAVSGTNARYLGFNSTVASTYNHNRAYGFTVRCLKD